MQFVNPFLQSVSNLFALDAEVKSYFTFKNFLFLIGIYLLGYGSLFISDIHYADDQVRRLMGGRSFDEVARYVNEYVIGLWNLSDSMLNAAPFFQLLAILVLATITLSAMAIFKVSKGYWQMISASIIGLFPLFVGNMLYKVDAPFMMLSILFCLLPFLFQYSKHTFCIHSLLAAFLILSTYQVTFTAYIMILLLMILDQWNNKQVINWKYWIGGFSFFIIGVVIYKLIFWDLGKVGNVDTQMPKVSQFFPVAVSNFKQYISQTIHLLDSRNIAIIFTIGILFIFTNVHLTKRNYVVAISASIIIMACILILSAGFNLYVSNFPDLRVRYYIAFSFSVGLLVIFSLKWDFKLHHTIYFIIVIYCCNLNNGLINAIKEKTKFREEVVRSLVYDFKNIVKMTPYSLYDVSHETSNTVPRIFNINSMPFQGKRHHYHLVAALIHDMDVGFDYWFLELFIIPHYNKSKEYDERDPFHLILQKQDYDIYHDGKEHYKIHFRY